MHRNRIQFVAQSRARHASTVLSAAKNNHPAGDMPQPKFSSCLFARFLLAANSDLQLQQLISTAIQPCPIARTEQLWPEFWQNFFYRLVDLQKNLYLREYFVKTAGLKS